MQVRLLGAVELVDDGGQVVPVPTPKRRVLLAALAMDLNRVVLVDRLLDTMWNGSPPPSARTALHVHVSGLRKLLTSDVRLETRANGYLLLGDRSCVDALAFDDLVAQAAATDDATAIEALRRAVRLWRGRPFVDAPATELGEIVASGLEERRLAALESLAELMIAAGRHSEVLADLAVAVDRNPLRESLVRMQMLALFAASRQADALSLYDRTRRQLAHHLGVDAGPQLQAAHRQVFDSRRLPAVTNPAVPDPPPAEQEPSTYRPSELPREVGGFVGRVEELGWLDTAATSTADGRDRRIAVVVGPAGVGKTSLVVSWAHRVADEYPGGQLFMDFGGFGSTEPLPIVTALNSLLRSLEVADEAIPSDPEALVELYRTTVARRRLLLILDNVRCTEQVRPMLPSGPGSLAIVTSRNGLNRLVAQEGATALQLEPLPRQESLDLLAYMVGRKRLNSNLAAVGRVADLCEDLPLALRIVGAQLAAQPRCEIADLADELADKQRRLPVLGVADDVSVEASLTATYRSLPDQSRRFFLLLGLHPGPGCDPHAAAATAAIPVREAKRLLAGLAVVNLLEPAAAGDGYLMKDLVRAYCRQVGAKELGDDDRDPAFARLLDHYNALAGAARMSLTEGLVPDPPVDRGAPAAVPAFLSGAAALRWFAAEEPTIRSLVLLAHEAGLYPEAWRLANNCLLAYLRCGTAEQFIATASTAVLAASAGHDQIGSMVAHKVLGMAYLQAGKLADARGSFGRALDIARQERRGSPEAREIRLCMLVLLCSGAAADADIQVGIDDDLITRSQVPESSVHTAPCLACLAQAQFAAGDVEGALELMEQGVEVVDRQDSDSLRHHLALAQARVLRDVGRSGGAVAGYARALGVSRGDLRIEEARLD